MIKVTSFDSLSTSDANPANSKASFAPPAGSNGIVDLKVLASSGGNSMQFVCRASWANGAALNISGMTKQSLAPSSSDSFVLGGLNVNLAQSQGVLYPVVTGLAATAVNWTVEAEYLSN